MFLKWKDYENHIDIEIKAVKNLSNEEGKKKLLSFFNPVVLPNWRVSAFVRFIVVGLHKKLS